MNGSDAERLIEANLLTQDEQLISTLTQWFDSTLLPQSRVVDAEIIAQARRDNARRPPPPQYRASLLDEARARSPIIRGPIFVWVYSHDAQDLDLEVAEIGRLRLIGNLEYWQDPGEEALAHPPASYVLDFDTSGKGKPRFAGVYRTLHEGQVVKFRHGTTTALLCVPTKGRVLDQPIGDRNAWRVAAQTARQVEPTREVWHLSEFAAYL